MRRRLLGLAVGLACLGSAGLAAEETYSLAPRLTPGQIIAYDGTYRLQIPSSKYGKNLLLARLAFGLLLRVESVDAGGTTLTAEYDRFDWELRRLPAGTPTPYSPLGRPGKLRLSPEGRLEESPAGGWLRDVWPGWPARPLKIGESWRVEGGPATLGGGEAKGGREFRLREVRTQNECAVALLDYLEQGTIDAIAVRLPGGPGRLAGAIEGVGQLRMNLALGLVERAAAVSLLEGLVRPEGGDVNAAAMPVRLKIETSISLRSIPVGSAS